MDIGEIYDFLVESQGVKKTDLSPEVDLNEDLGICGDDFFELEEEFSKKYGVDMENYRWYFHHGEEGFGVGGLLFKPPYRQVSHIAVTPKILLEAATLGKWPLQYPEHTIRDRTAEFAVNKLVFLALIGFIVLCVIQRIT